MCSQTNGNTQVKLMDIEWELGGTLIWIFFQYSSFAANFNLVVDPLVLKFVLIILDHFNFFSKNCMMFLLELDFGMLFKSKSFSQIRVMIISFSMLCLGLLFYTREHFTKLNYFLIFKILKNIFPRILDFLKLNFDTKY